ncbi:MAG: 16S rRNA pseudouridine(516) synthase [Betaproteobacteria bacterium]|jgi:16S rRNA pseudouridine516 synthase|nr:16S rRNA pseudouridine(516) synthase [Betaproteobacteria bacterium]
MHLAQILFTQGFGTRRLCAGLVAAGRVRIGGCVVDDPHADIATDGLVFEVEGRPWPYREHALLMLHKPAGYECSQKPRHHPSVLSLLPQPLRNRGVQPVGRLDEDTTGLLLLTDDGALIHRLTSPKWHVPKVYEVGTRHPVTDEEITQLLAGVVLDDDPAPVRAAACERSGGSALRLTLTEGKYHQVKRMVAAVGNRVEALHRSRFGALPLPPDLPPGGWRWVDALEIDSVSAGPVADSPAARG